MAVEGVLSTLLGGAGGSALVGFQQEGAGAILRTAQDKMRESVSVLDFGAVADAVINFVAVGGYTENPLATDNRGISGGFKLRSYCAYKRIYSSGFLLLLRYVICAGFTSGAATWAAYLWRCV